MANRKWAILALALLPVVAAGGWLARYEYGVRPARLRQAGPLNMRVMPAPLPARAFASFGAGKANAAFFYVRAANAYSRRRAPQGRRPSTNPFAHEPAIQPQELRDLLAGVAQASCDLYPAQMTTLQLMPPASGPRPWIFQPTSVSYEGRPYLPVFRLLARAALKEGKRRERLHRDAEALGVYRSVALFGYHLLQHPGCLQDMDLGVEIAEMGIHYAQRLPRARGNRGVMAGAEVAYADLEAYRRGVRGKFEQLGNPEAAIAVLTRDASPVWRVEAAAACDQALRFGGLDRLEAYHVRRALRRASEDRAACVRVAAFSAITQSSNSANPRHFASR